MIAKIAGGGMSAIYLGRRLAPADEIPSVVALKIMRHDVRGATFEEMFLAEGRLISRLVHPNIVRTHEVGSDEEQAFIAMELLLGKTFAVIHDTLAARGVRLNPEIAAWAAARVADALHYAHELHGERGEPLALVHRDVNPANIFATFEGDVKLFDFGLAKVTAGERSGSQLLAGKLSYLSPEQIMQMPIDRRSDVFSLGTTLWELLTGARLFLRDTDAETVRAVQLGPIPDPRSVAAEIPEELARIVKAALERNRAHRYATAAELARDLDAFVRSRAAPAEVSARLARLVDALFPGEQKRQSGWLKPAIGSSRGMAAVTPRVGPVALRSTPPPPSGVSSARPPSTSRPSAPPPPVRPSTRPDGGAAGSRSVPPGPPPSTGAGLPRPDRDRVKRAPVPLPSTLKGAPRSESGKSEAPPPREDPSSEAPAPPSPRRS